MPESQDPWKNPLSKSAQSWRQTKNLIYVRGMVIVNSFDLNQAGSSSPSISVRP